MTWGRRIRRTRTGRFQVRLPVEERRILATLPDQLAALLEDPDDEAVARLFPTAYPDDPYRDAEYQVLQKDELVARRQAALEVVARTVGSEELTEDELTAWMGCVNDVRLVLGTRLDVSEDMEEVPEHDPRAPAFALYTYLGWLLEQIVDALTGSLPPPSQH